MSDTPLTDALTFGCHFGPFVEAIADHARRMERERDHERRKVAALCKALDNPAQRSEQWERWADDRTANASVTGAKRTVDAGLACDSCRFWSAGECTLDASPFFGKRVTDGCGAHVSTNAYALAEERSDDSQQRVVGASESKPKGE